MFLTLKLFVADLRTVFQEGQNPYAGPLGLGAGKSKAIVRLVMQVVISIAVVGLSCYVIADSSQSQDTKKGAFSALGVVVGYWLR